MRQSAGTIGPWRFRSSPHRADARQAAAGHPGGPGWHYEPKWDGFRALVFRDGAEVYIQSRDLKPLNRYFPELEEPLRTIGKPKDRFVLDGEIVIATEES